MYIVLWVILGEEDHMDDTELYESILLKWIFKMKKWGRGWIELVLDTDCICE